MVSPKPFDKVAFPVNSFADRGTWLLKQAAFQLGWDITYWGYADFTTKYEKSPLPLYSFLGEGKGCVGCPVPSVPTPSPAAFVPVVPTVEEPVSEDPIPPPSPTFTDEAPATPPQDLATEEPIAVVSEVVKAPEEDLTPTPEDLEQLKLLSSLSHLEISAMVNFEMRRNKGFSKTKELLRKKPSMYFGVFGRMPRKAMFNKNKKF